MPKKLWLGVIGLCSLNWMAKCFCYILILEKIRYSVSALTEVPNIYRTHPWQHLTAFQSNEKFCLQGNISIHMAQPDIQGL